MRRLALAISLMLVNVLSAQGQVSRPSISEASGYVTRRGGPEAKPLPAWSRFPYTLRFSRTPSTPPLQEAEIAAAIETAFTHNRHEATRLSEASLSEKYLDVQVDLLEGGFYHLQATCVRPGTLRTTEPEPGVPIVTASQGPVRNLVVLGAVLGHVIEFQLSACAEH